MHRDSYAYHLHGRLEIHNTVPRVLSFWFDLRTVVEINNIKIKIKIQRKTLCINATPTQRNEIRL